jgi:hypothetical protein
MNKEYEELVETSNRHHEAVYDYIEKHGVDERFAILIEGKYRWLKMIAERCGIELGEY